MNYPLGLRDSPACLHENAPQRDDPSPSGKGGRRDLGEVIIQGD